MAISRRHKNHSLWFVTQRFTKIPLLLRDQIEMLFIWRSKNRDDFKKINDENDIMTDEEFTCVKNQLKKSKHACLYARLEFPEGYKISTG